MILSSFAESKQRKSLGETVPEEITVLEESSKDTAFYDAIFEKLKYLAPERKEVDMSGIFQNDTVPVLTEEDLKVEVTITEIK